MAARGGAALAVADRVAEGHRLGRVARQFIAGGVEAEGAVAVEGQARRGFAAQGVAEGVTVNVGRDNRAADRGVLQHAAGAAAGGRSVVGAGDRERQGGGRALAGRVDDRIGEDVLDLFAIGQRLVGGDIGIGAVGIEGEGTVGSRKRARARDRHGLALDLDVVGQHVAGDGRAVFIRRVSIGHAQGIGVAGQAVDPHGAVVELDELDVAQQVHAVSAGHRQVKRALGRHAAGGIGIDHHRVGAAVAIDDVIAQTTRDPVVGAASRDGVGVIRGDHILDADELVCADAAAGGRIVQVDVHRPGGTAVVHSVDAVFAAISITHAVDIADKRVVARAAIDVVAACAAIQFIITSGASDRVIAAGAGNQRFRSAGLRPQSRADRQIGNHVR